MSELEGYDQAPTERVLERPEGEFEGRPGAPGVGRFDPATSVEIPELTTERSKTFRNVDGSLTVEQSVEPVRFRDGRGAWVDVDVVLRSRSEGGVAPRASASGLVIGDALRSGELLSVGSPAGRVSVSLPDVVVPASDLPVVGEAQATVRGRGGVDALVEATPTGFKQSVVVAGSGGPSSYRLSFGLPAGVAARSDAGGVEFVDRSGGFVARFGGGVAFDAAGAEVPVSTALVGQAGSTATVEVSVEAGWLAAGERAFPVVIDPNWTTWPPLDTYVQSGSSTPQWSSSTLHAGTFDGGWVRRSLLKFPQLPTPNANLGVVEAHLELYTNSGTTCDPAGLEVRGLAEGFGSSTVWSNQPATDGYGVVSTTAFNRGFSGSCASAYQNVDVTDLAQRWLDGSQPNHGLQLAASDETDTAGYKRFRSGDSGNLQPKLSMTYQTVPAAPGLQSPPDGATLSTATPTLEASAVTDPDSSGSVRYWFRLWTEPTGDEEGLVVDSGWLASTSWEVPQGALVNGTSWRWKVFATDESGASVTTSAHRSFSLDARLGLAHPGPSDEMGPVSVNLSSGNATVSVPGGGVSTLGGGIGVDFSFNSQAVAPSGLSGEYYNDTDTDLVFDDALVLSRVDPQPSFDWGLGSPNPRVDRDRFLVRWSGLVTVPSSGTYSFGAVHDDAVRITVDSTVVLDRWSLDQTSAVPVFDGSVSLTAGTAVPITVEYAEGTGTAEVALYVEDGTGVAPVPSSWLSPANQAEAVLPAKWSMSLPGAGFLLYTGISVSNDAATLTGVGGLVEEFTRDPAGGWLAPAGSQATLSQADDGTFTLHTDLGMVYGFGPDGTVRTVTMPGDTTGATSPTYTWTTITAGATTFPRLAAVTDPVSGRDVTLTWKTPANSCPDSASPPPVGMLCSIEWWDGTETTLGYTSGGLLARIVAPGNQVTDFAYADGNIVVLRDPLAADAAAAGVRGSGADGWAILHWILSDTNPNPSERRATQVSLPAPLVGASNPTHHYSYGSSSTEVDVDGLTQPNGYWRLAGFDAEGRHTTDTDALGRTTTTTWDTENERVSWVDDPAGLRTTTVYDAEGRPAHTHGPAPSGWFNGDGTPQSGYASQVPHTEAGYDEDWAGLAAYWWDNTTLAGPEDVRGTGVGDPDGDINQDWGGGAPAGIGDSDFSGRLTGTITFPTAGTYQLALGRQGRARLYLDGELLIERWDDETSETTPGVPFTATAGQAAQITIEYADAVGAAYLGLRWTPPGGSAQIVPGQYLAAGYGLQTSTTDPTGHRTGTGYADPTVGRPTATIVDPGGLALTTSAGYESGGFGRQTTRTLPAGNQWTYAYYGAAETRDNPCTGPSDPAVQAGAAKTRTGPTPAAGSAIVEEAVYDAAGRVVATRIGSEPWTCVTYDERSRVIERTVPSFGGEAARTVTYDHAVDDNPLVSEVTDPAGTITTTIDLLGRPVEVTDVWDQTTTFAYDQPGRLTERDGPEGTQTYTYNAAGELTAQGLDGATVATVTYAGNGRVQTYAYPAGAGNGGNGTTSAVLGYDDLGRTTSLEWLTPTATRITRDQHTYDLAGRLVDQTIDGADPNPAEPNFTYDAAGRLTRAHVPGQQLDYGFAAAGGCGANPAAGKNSNRTSLHVDGSPAGTYCYDAADRLTSVPGNDHYPNIAHDAHGNMTVAATGTDAESYTYDADNRHLSTDQAGSGDVRYVRDATDEIVERKVDGTTVARYSGPAVLDTAGTVIERVIALPGGVLLTKRTGGDTWSYPNLRGEIVATANAAGAKQGPTLHYDPYGQALTAVPDNAPGGYDIGWTGQRHTEHQPGLRQHIQMGARQYSPELGRFLESDPIEGGSANDYDYADGDPVNRADHDGHASRVSIHEWLYCLGHTATCAYAYGIAATLASEATRRVSAASWIRNALRHILWAGLLFWKWGTASRTPWTVLLVHEIGSSGRDSRTDWLNNRIGMELGRYARYRRFSFGTTFAYLYYMAALLINQGKVYCPYRSGSRDHCIRVI